MPFKGLVKLNTKFLLSICFFRVLSFTSVCVQKQRTPLRGISDLKNDMPFKELLKFKNKFLVSICSFHVYIFYILAYASSNARPKSGDEKMASKDKEITMGPKEIMMTSNPNTPPESNGFLKVSTSQGMCILLYFGNGPTNSTQN